MPLELSSELKAKIDGYAEPVAVFDAAMDLVYGNQLWHDTHALEFLFPSASVSDSSRNYEIATLKQGVQEVISGASKLFTRKVMPPADVRAGCKQVTILPFPLPNKEVGAEVWLEDSSQESRH